MQKLSMVELGRMSVDEFKRARKNPVMIVLDNIRSMHNVGSVFRTADAFLAEGICLCGYTPQPPHRPGAMPVRARPPRHVPDIRPAVTVTTPRMTIYWRRG